ncbi:MAG TPA: DUF3054 domain-containing protein [Ktedonobacterales bacterium]|nr:DUF3054 domain-containing protein [Ktedonobacterales bacterium]
MRETLPVAGEPVASSTVAARPTWLRVGALVAGDALSFVVFATVGRHSHNEASGLSAIGVTLATAAPFAAGWFAVSPFVGAFRRAKTASLKAMLTRTELAWLCAWPAAALLRWAFGPDHKLPLSFAIVILIANAVFLGVWRSLFALVEGRRRA